MRCSQEEKCRLALAKEAHNRKKILFYRPPDIKLRNRMVFEERRGDEVRSLLDVDTGKNIKNFMER